MEDLLLKIRLEALKSNLTQIQNIYDSVMARRQEIDQLSVNIENARNHLDKVASNVTFLKLSAITKSGKQLVDPSLMVYITTAYEEVEVLSKALNEAMENIGAIQIRRPNIEAIANAVKEELDDTTKDWFTTINTNLEALRKQGPTKPVLEKAWRDYTGILTEKLNLVFSDYVQFLGGLALRDAGLDAHICQIADELIKSCGAIGRTHWNALTIPASQEAVTLARSIRMGFPEWTIWAVSLTAHELGQVAIRNSTWKQYIEEEARRFKKAKTKLQQYLSVYLADAFATYAMGPAYACAALLLRFNPLSAYKDNVKHPADAKRAHVILTMLKKMRDKERADIPPYSYIIDKLEKGWEAALMHTQTAGELSDEMKKVLEGWTTRMFDELVSKPASGLYDGKRWNSTKQALEKLIEGKEGKDFANNLKGDEGWRDVLNAAWACRIDNVDVSGISEKAQSLWELITEKKREKARRTSQSSGPPSGGVPPSLKGEKPPWQKVGG